ncbi:MAG: HAD family phosphatase [Actinobacteria bacterium]|nr:HAD family phosphatase [Actinomycetota bacterium]
MKYRLAAIDLDDTLLDSEKKISRPTLQIIREMNDKGLIIVLATGRNYNGSRRYHDELGLSTPMINCSGAVVVDSRKNELFSLPVNFNDAKKVLLFAKQKNVHAQIESSYEYYFEKHNEYTERHAFFYGYRGVEIQDLLNRNDIEVLKVLILSEPHIIGKIKSEAVKKFHGLKVLQSLPSFLEFNNPGTSKGMALKFLSSYYSVKKEEIIAFGDSELDVSMMEHAGFFVAMGNASDEIKKMADYVTDCNDNDGVAKALKELVK